MRRRTFYIASSRDGMQSVLRLRSALAKRGWDDAFPWPLHFNHVCSIEICGVESRPDLARWEIEAARGCDLFVGIARLGKGSHVELGAALAGSTKRIVLVGVERRDSVFYEAFGVVALFDMKALEGFLQLDNGEVS